MEASSSQRSSRSPPALRWPLLHQPAAPIPASGDLHADLQPYLRGPGRIHGKWGEGVTAANFNTSNASLTQSSANQFIDVRGFTTTPNFVFGNTARTAPYNIYGPGNYQLDIGLLRSFPLHLGESSRLNLRAEMYNVTNHTLFGVASSVWGSSNFGQVTSNPNYNRRSVQLSGRIDF